LTNDDVAHILSAARVFEDGNATADINGSARPVHVKRRVRMSGSPIPPEVPIVVQVSRWDRLKDPLGVMDGFVRHIAPKTDGYLVLAGPAATSVRDDPEQPEVLAELETRRSGLEPAIRDRVRIAQLPMEDEGENAIVVNALQRHAAVVVQKSVAEGFGLTVAEAMWKARPVVASRVGGIEDQIESGRSGILIEPDDLEQFGNAVVELLRDQAKAARLGTEAKARVTREFLTPRHLIAQGSLVRSLID
ncbi:MAG: glycosyltransferase, partial [Chloroflexi bacterium]